MKPAEIVAQGLSDIIADAFAIADDCARADVETYLNAVSPYPGPWYDLHSMQEEDREMVGRSVRYLEARGRLERKEGEPHLIRPREVAA